MFRKILDMLNELLVIIDFPGSSYLNLWSLALLVISIWVCVKTKSLPTPVAAIFASIVTAYSANNVARHISGDCDCSTKERKSNDTNDSKNTSK